jgi:hypothetical protein
MKFSSLDDDTDDDTDTDIEASLTTGVFGKSLALICIELNYPGTSRIFKSCGGNNTDYGIVADPVGVKKSNEIKSYRIVNTRANRDVLTANQRSCIVHQPVTPQSITLLKELFSDAKSLTVEKASVKSTMNLIKQMSADGKVVLSFSDEVKEKFKALPEDNADRKQFFEYMEQSSHSHHHKSARL